MPVDLLLRVCKMLPCDIVQLYGMTEASPLVTSTQRTDNRDGAGQGADQLAHFRAGSVPLLLGGQAVIDILPGPPIFHHPGAFQLREMTRNPRLAHPENFLKLGHGKFFPFEKKQESQTSRVGQQFQKINS